jgi:hypothetical protein
MNNHDEMVFENDSLHGLEDTKDKTKTQEDTGNQGGYQGPNRKERDQAKRVLETRQPTDIGKSLGGSQALPSERQRREEVTADKARHIVYTSHQCEEVMSDATTMDMTKRQVPFATRDKTKGRVSYATRDKTKRQVLYAKIKIEARGQRMAMFPEALLTRT